MVDNAQTPVGTGACRHSRCSSPAAPVFCFVFWVISLLWVKKTNKRQCLRGNNSLILTVCLFLACQVSFMSPAEIFLFGKTKLSKTLMPALVPKTVIMNAKIVQYSQRQAHFEMQWGVALANMRSCVCVHTLVMLFGPVSGF